MFFNPLFISNASTGNTVEGTKKNKFTNSNYLFANIINVSKEKLSFSEPNIDLDENNKALFNSLKSTSFQLSKKPDANTNQFISDELALSAFLSQILEQINEANFNLKSIDEENSKIEATVLPEQINQIVESVVAGNKISIPISNYGKVAFVEIQKLDKNLLNGNSPKGIKLGSAKQTEIQLTDADINKVVSGISLALKEVFNFENIEMESNKTQAIVAKIKNEFSKLVPSKDETFQPQKNILTNLISGIEKELKLNSTESNELKKVIVSQFAKLINEKSTNTKGVTPTTDLVLLKEISEELALTKSEQELIGSFNLSVVSSIELKEKIEFLMSKSEKHAELKPILNKINNFIKDVPPQPKENVLAVKLPLQEIAKELKLTPIEVETVKNIASEKVSLLELSKELKAEAVKVNASPVLKAVSAKMDSFISKTAEVNTNVKTDKLPLQEIAKELKLTPVEVEAVKNIVSGKKSLAELSKELKVEAIKVNASPVIKTVSAKLESFISKTAEVNTIVKADKLPLQEIAKELKLTPNESKLVDELGVQKIDLSELKKSIKTELANQPNNKELKSLLSKVECIDLTSKTSVSSKQEINTNTDLAFSKNENIKSKMVDKVKTGLKNIFNSSDSEKKEIQSAKSNFVITLKSEKSPESLNIDKLTKAESKSPELLKKSIYSSKESIELTKVKIIPINEDVAKKLEQKSVDNDFRKASYKNITGEFKSNNAGDHSKSNYSESKNFTNSQSNLNDAKINNLETNKSDSIDKTFDKQVFNSSQEINNKAEVSKSKLAGETKSNDIKVNETLMPKTAFVEHQIRNSDLRVMPKTVVQKLDLKNIKEEISNLIQKGEKKSVEFQLNPENLGKMNIKLEVINKMVSASIKVDNETTQQAVQNSLEGLKTSLNQQGVQLSSLNVSLADSEEKNNRYFKQKKKNNNTMNLKVNGFDDKFAHKNLGYNNYDFIA